MLVSFNPTFSEVVLENSSKTEVRLGVDGEFTLHLVEKVCEQSFILITSKDSRAFV